MLFTGTNEFALSFVFKELFWGYKLLFLLYYFKTVYEAIEGQLLMVSWSAVQPRIVSSRAAAPRARRLHGVGVRLQTERWAGTPACVFSGDVLILLSGSERRNDWWVEVSFPVASRTENILCQHGSWRRGPAVVIGEEVCLSGRSFFSGMLG